MKTSAGFQQIALSVALCVCSSALSAQDLGVVGPVYPIAEPDMLATIQNRLKTMKENGDLARIENGAKKQYRAYAERPTGVKLPRARQTTTHYIDPSITLASDIKDDHGRILFPAGTRVNPLDYFPLTDRLVFFDGNDPVQVRWVKSILDKDPAHIKPILVNGPVLYLMKRWKTRVYFDQRGRLVERFDIESLPATMNQNGKRLEVMEYRLRSPD